MTQSIERRQFLIGSAAGVAAMAATQSPAPAAEAPSTPPLPTASGDVPTYQILTATEVAFLTVMADSMIPADSLSPSGSDCGVVVFIDRQLAGSFGAGAKLYRSGPFQPAAAGQGYQLPMTPLEFFRAGIAAADRWSRKTTGKAFDRLGEADRVKAMKEMESGKAEFENFNAKAFFAACLQIVMEGFFSDPIYGGNRDKASWRMIGYPGLPATYADKIEAYRGKRYEAEPQSIADFS